MAFIGLIHLVALAAFWAAPAGPVQCTDIYFYGSLMSVESKMTGERKLTAVFIGSVDTVRNQSILLYITLFDVGLL